MQLALQAAGAGRGDLTRPEPILGDTDCLPEPLGRCRYGDLGCSADIFHSGHFNLQNTTFNYDKCRRGVSSCLQRSPPTSTSTSHTTMNQPLQFYSVYPKYFDRLTLCCCETLVLLNSTHVYGESCGLDWLVSILLMVRSYKSNKCSMPRQILLLSWPSELSLAPSELAMIQSAFCIRPNRRH